MKLPWTLVVVMTTATLCVSTPTIANTIDNETTSKYKWRYHAPEDIKDRFDCLDFPFEAKFSTEVNTILKEYFTSAYKDTEIMLGRTTRFFPIFEHYLALRQIPLELKYLPIIESGLKVNARSHVGAGGLWQLDACNS